MNLIKRITKQTIIFLLPLSILSAFIEWKKFPISILIGGIIGLLNLKSLTKGVEELAGTYQQPPKGRLYLASFLRLFIIACILVIFILLKAINILGILIGFTGFFIILVKEGLKAAKEF